MSWHSHDPPQPLPSRHKSRHCFPPLLAGAYICCLSNPQNLDIGALVGSGVESSPFFRVLDAEPRMIMLANSNTEIHKRKWCVLKAPCLPRRMITA